MAKKKMTKAQAASVRWEDTPDQERPVSTPKPETLARRERKAQNSGETEFDAGSSMIKKTFPVIIVAAIVLGFIASFIVIGVASLTGSQ